MNREQWSRLRRLFGELENIPEAERSAFIAREAADDEELRAALQRVLAASASNHEFFAAPSAARHGSIGPYRLLEILGEGGFGVVYLAEQTHPIRRRVALKLIKPGMDTKQVIARFEAERRALALMDHPGIAQVHEAGETESGHPYFVMEYVEGVPLTAYCDREKLRISARLQLFLQVCDAIQHAHQRGVIHRDIKPSNVLVAVRDGVPTPKLIDFGIVKATTESDTDTILGPTVMTREGMVVGTLGYMSPEQAGGAATVDTRSDIYSLGVLLYELLAGAPPFDAERLRAAALSEAVRVIREEDPPTLAARLVQSGEHEATRIAEQRSVDPRRLVRELKGELQWVTLRAIEKNPNRRYSSATELIADVRRHLANEPVLAGPPSKTYRLAKFARRHRVAVTAAAFALAGIVAGGIAATIGFTRAVRAEHVARREAESAQQVADFLVELFQASAPDRSKGEVVTARMLLDTGAQRIEGKGMEDPLVRGRVLEAMGGSYMSLGHYDEGIRLKREALQVTESAGRFEREVARRLEGLAQALSMAAQDDSVVVLVDRAIALLQASDEPDTKLLARCYYRKGQWWNENGETAIADSFATIALQMAESEGEPNQSQLMRMHAMKANIAHRRFDLETAERHYLRQLELSIEVDEPSWSVRAHRRLASVYRSLDDPEKAATHADEGVRLARQIYAPDHPNLADALGGQAEAFIAQGRFEDAIPVREEALEIQRAKGTPEGVAYELNALAILYQATNQFDNAIARAEEACEVRRKSGQESERTFEALATLANCYASAGMTQRADSTFRAAIGGFERLGSESIFSIETEMNYAALCRDTGRMERAESLYAHAEASLDSTSEGTRPYLGRCRINHGYLRSKQGRHDEAEAMIRSGFALQFGENPKEGADLGGAYVLWAAARAGAGDIDGAIEQLRCAAACGATTVETAKYPELASLRSRPDYPLVSSP